MIYHKPLLVTFQPAEIAEKIGGCQSAYVQFGIQQTAFNYDGNNIPGQQIVLAQKALENNIVTIKKTV